MDLTTTRLITTGFYSQYVKDFSVLRIAEANVGACAAERSVVVVLKATSKKIKRQSKGDCEAPYFEARLIMQAF